jgi:hypothetical protein
MDSSISAGTIVFYNTIENIEKSIENIVGERNILQGTYVPEIDRYKIVAFDEYEGEETLSQFFLSSRLLLFLFKQALGADTPKTFFIYKNQRAVNIEPEDISILFGATVRTHWDGAILKYIYY